EEGSSPPVPQQSRKHRSRLFLGEADEAILLMLATYQCLTTQQLLRARGLTARARLSRRLADLVRRGYLYAEPFRQTIGSPNVYVLTEV
ncbi:MAG: replication-relaxation family protein, partial [Chloroflexota bacterium]|nr:replication-relaxation family protein [Chloroflexota bacterium]